MRNHRRSLVYSVLLWLCISPGFAVSTNPYRVFPSVKNATLPSKAWLSRPYATNAWFINFAVANERESYAINSFPYLVRQTPTGLEISYRKAALFTNPNASHDVSAVYYQFTPQASLGLEKPYQTYGIGFQHGLATHLIWSDNEGTKLRIPLLSGSPYISGLYDSAVPIIRFNHPIQTINAVSVHQPTAPAKRFVIDIGTGSEHHQQWLLYTKTPMQFRVKHLANGDVLKAEKPFTGWVRLILVKDQTQQLDNLTDVADRYSENIPLDYRQQFDEHRYTWEWLTQNHKPPLMLALAHHQLGQNGETTLRYESIKGTLQGYALSTWSMPLPNPKLAFLPERKLDAKEQAWVKRALLIDMQNLQSFPFPDDSPYQVGKRLARAANLALIADKIQAQEAKTTLLSIIKQALSRKIQGQGEWVFQYDETWGGIIPSKDDYGAKHYTDHHFHYGYWLFAFAVVAKFEPKWLERPVAQGFANPKAWVDCLIRDYANPTQSDAYFPHQRYQDDYAGHSWASGLTALPDGQNQQSSSEAANAYYSLALYADAIKDRQLADWARFLNARELVAAQTYWQIGLNNRIYPKAFVQSNRVLGNLWASKVEANPFFGKICQHPSHCQMEYAYGMQMLPFNGLSTSLLDKSWLQSAYQDIMNIIRQRYGAITPAWQWILIKGVSPVMPTKERAFFLQKAVGSHPAEYDLGDSKTLTIYYLLHE